MELQDLIDTYVYNPKEELKQIIIEQVKKIDQDTLISVYNHVSNRVNEDIEVRENYIEIQKFLLNELKKNNNVKTSKIL